jgi:sortase A
MPNALGVRAFGGRWTASNPLTIDLMTGEGTRGSRRTKANGRRRVSVIGVLGELLITAGVLVLLFLGWQVSLGDLLQSNSQRDEALALSESWGRGEGVAPPKDEHPDPAEPVVTPAPGNAEQFANLIVPRFGPDYVRPVLEGVGTTDVLNYGIGHYPGTQVPGGVGNAAFAAHRTGHGSPFFDIEKLQVGDSIYFETQAGWYRYVVRSLEYVTPEGVGVLDPVPQHPELQPTDRLLTLTSCNPIHTASERIIVYGIFDTWYPREQGAPPELTGATA